MAAPRLVFGPNMPYEESPFEEESSPISALDVGRADEVDRLIHLGPWWDQEFRMFQGTNEDALLDTNFSRQGSPYSDISYSPASPRTPDFESRGRGHTRGERTRGHRTSPYPPAGSRSPSVISNRTDDSQSASDYSRYLRVPAYDFPRSSTSSPIPGPSQWQTPDVPSVELDMGRLELDPLVPEIDTDALPSSFSRIERGGSASGPGRQMVSEMHAERHFRLQVASEGVSKANKARRKNPQDPGAFVCGICRVDFTAKHNLECT